MTPSNQSIAQILKEIATYLEMQEVPFKPRAYERVAGVIEGLEEEVADIYKRGGVKALEEIPGVGRGIAERIEELLKTGRMKYYEELKKKTPVDLSSLGAIEGLGPKSVKKLYQKLHVRSLSDLELVARAGKIARLEGFGAKSEEKILKGIEFSKKSGGRFVLGLAMPQVRAIEARLRAVHGVLKLTVAGSVRRRKETIGDVDILITSEHPKSIMDAFVAMPEVVQIMAHGETKSSVKLRTGLNVDVRVVPSEFYGAALNYFTGSKDHNVALRQIAMGKGLKLNEYGLFESADQRRQHADQRRKVGVSQRQVRVSPREAMVAGRTEEEIYKALEMDYIEPEMRENLGEIEAARKHELPKLIGYGDLQGDLQVQTNWTDGSDSIEAMAKAATAQGLKYIVITDHTKRLAMTHGLDEKRIVKQWAEIDRVNKKLHASRSTFHVLKGTECDILKDGSLDLPDSILSKLDVVGVSVHSFFNLTEREQTERVKRAMENPHVDIFFHPTGRILNRREPYQIDMEEIIKIAKKTGTVLEIDAYPDRSDLKDEYIRKCVEAGVKMSIDSDAHSPTHFSYLEYGIAQARRGWAEKKDIINAWSVEKMLGLLKGRR